MSLSRYTRFAPSFPTLFAELDDLMRDFTVSPDAERSKTASALVPAADIAETEKTVEIDLDMPGVKVEDLEVKVEGNVLSVTAERKAEPAKREWMRQERPVGRFARSFTLPPALVGTTPEASYKNGVLLLTLPKKEEVLPKTVKVKVEA